MRTSLIWGNVLIGVCFTTSVVAFVSSEAALIPEQQPPKESKWRYPKIKNQGKVVHLPEAAAQPKAGSKIVVNLTTKGALHKLNPGIGKLARFVNIYAGAGKKALSVKIVAVLHGNATVCSLNHEAYQKHTGVRQNPNLSLINELKRNGVVFTVCGQALSHKGYRTSQVHKDFTVSVSALTALANKQRQGYAYIPLR